MPTVKEKRASFMYGQKTKLNLSWGRKRLFLLIISTLPNPGTGKGKKIFSSEKRTDDEFLLKYNIRPEELQKKIFKSRETLMKVRNKRVRPGLDDKILTSWNALMLKGYIDAYRAYGEEKFLKGALKNADFLNLNSIDKNNGMTRNYKNGKSSVAGMLDDYSFTISAFIDLYQATCDEKWLYKANDLTEYTILHFFDASSGMFYYTPDNHSDLIARKMEISDNVIPSSNSEMADNLFLLGNYFNREPFIEKAQQMLKNVQKNLKENIFYYSNWGLLGIHFIKPLFEVAIVGSDWDTIRKTLDKNYLPDVIYLGGNNEGTLNLLKNKLVPGQTTVYVCVDKACKIPVTEAEKALAQIKVIL